MYASPSQAVPSMMIKNNLQRVSFDVMCKVEMSDELAVEQRVGYQP